MEHLGLKLKALRSRWRLSLKEVEDRSLQLAEEWGRPAFRISASWLHRVERENRDLSAAKLIVLAAIYNLSAKDLLELSPDSRTPTSMMQPVSLPNSTLILEGGQLEEQAKQWLPDAMLFEETQNKTSLAVVDSGILPINFRRAVIGLDDHYLAPMINAGSHVLVDTSKRVIAARRDWNNEFDRPIYFLLTRDGYRSGFCELDPRAEWLTLVPHPLSFATLRRWRYKKEVEVIGTVTAYSMRRAA